MTDFSIYTQPKVDSHCHVLDPQGFAYASEVAYRPAGQETGSADYFAHVLAAYGVKHALLVGPNSGYGFDNRCLLSAIARGQGRFKGIAVLPLDTSSAQLAELQAQGIVGVAFNYSLHGLAYYAQAEPLFARLAALSMFVQVQVEHSQMAALEGPLKACGAPILIDHCGRPSVAEGPSAGMLETKRDTLHELGGPGFTALLRLAETGRATVKLSGFAKFSRQAYPFADALPYVHALLQAYGPRHCLWASDWPFLKADSRLDYGTLLQFFAQTVPDAAMRHSILWDTPMRLFGFGDAG